MRINFYSGPGAGKSTVAASVFAELKRRGHNVELAHEYVKTWAYLGRMPKSFDEVYIFGKQLHAEDVLLQSGVEHVIADCPIMLAACYAEYYGHPCVSEITSIAKEFGRVYPSIDIFLDRSGIPYREEEGCYQDFDQALEVDNKFKVFLQGHDVKYVLIPTVNQDEILSFIESHIGRSPLCLANSKSETKTTTPLSLWQMLSDLFNWRSKMPS